MKGQASEDRSLNIAICCAPPSPSSRQIYIGVGQDVASEGVLQRRQLVVAGIP